MTHTCFLTIPIKRKIKNTRETLAARRLWVHTATVSHHRPPLIPSDLEIVAMEHMGFRHDAGVEGR